MSAPAKFRTFVDVENAAELTGWSLRHFRRIIEEDQIPFFEINGKMFILGRDLEAWQASQPVKAGAGEIGGTL